MEVLRMPLIDTPENRQRLCLECLECCHVIAVPTFLRGDRFKEFYTKRGFRVMMHQGLSLVVLRSTCPHLTDKGCSIYEQRPQVCREYDGRKDPIMRYICKWKELEPCNQMRLIEE